MQPGENIQTKEVGALMKTKQPLDLRRFYTVPKAMKVQLLLLHAQTAQWRISQMSREMQAVVGQRIMRDQPKEKTELFWSLGPSDPIRSIRR